MPPNVPPLTPQQRALGAAAMQARREMDAAFGDVELRKWCIEMALKAQLPERGTMALASQIYDFIMVSLAPLRSTNPPP